MGAASRPPARHAVGRAAVEAPRRQVLGHEDHLAHSGTELVHLGQHDVFGARPLQTAERRDGAEAAAPVATFGHLDVRPRRARPRTGQVQEVEGREGLVGDALVGVGALESPTQGDGHTEAHDQVDLGQRRAELVTVALRQASRHDQARPVVTGGGEVEDGVDRLLPGGLDEGAGVDDHEIGIVGRGGGLVAVAPQRPGQLVRVDLVLGTTQGLQPVTLGHQDNLPAKPTTGTPRNSSGEGGVRFHDLVDTMSQDIVDTCSGGVHGPCSLCR